MILQNNIKTLATSAALFSGLLLMTSCSSGGGGGGGESSTAGVPANAVTIDASNAEITVSSAASSVDQFGSSLPGSIPISVETTQNLNFKSALKEIKLSLRDNTTGSGIDLATGVTFEDGGDCLISGTYSQIMDVTSNGDNTTESGTASFSNCNDYNLILDGSISYSSTENSLGDYSDDVSGWLAISVPDSGLLVHFNGLVVNETGNYFDYTYTINQLTYSIDFVSTNGSGGGYLVTLTEPIVESSVGEFFSCPESGHITITGANGTTAEGIYNGDDTMTIKANGVVVDPAAFCYY